MARNFSLNIEEMASEKPLLATGNYAAIIVAATVSGKENKQFIRIDKESVFNKDTQQREETERYVLTGMFMLQLVLTSEKAKRVLLQDEPRQFINLNLKFNQTDGNLEQTSNVQFKQLWTLFDIDLGLITGSIDMNEVNSVPIPTELEHVENIDTLVAAENYWRQFFTLLGRILVQQQCRVRIVKRNKQENRGGKWVKTTIIESVVDNGDFNAPHIGLLPYVEGCENDL